jgi:adenylate cyclase
LERRLSAIVAADVVGYSRQIRVDEEGTLLSFRTLRHELIEPKIKEYRGRTVKLMGDGILVEFASVVDAVACVAEVQQALAARNSAIIFRVGVNLGDVVIDGQDIQGDGVNVAARLESLSDPGGMCISDAVYEQVRDRLNLAFEDFGKQSVKNIDRPVQAWKWSAEGAKKELDQGEEGSALPIDEKPSIAILPFENMSGDPDQDYFSDGISEDIITALSHWRAFPVIARNSSFSYRGRNVRVQTIANELSARYVLEGSVRKAGPRVRITAQLIDASTGHHVWAERYDRKLEDVFEVQDEITNRIAAAIVPELEHFEQRNARSKPTQNLGAWDYYLRGMETFHDDTCTAIAAAIQMFEAATRIDPEYSDAWARLGWCHVKLIMLGCDADPKASLAQGFESARRAISLDDSSAIAHMSLGTVHIWAEETEFGLAEAQIALELNPNFAHAAMAVGNRLDLVGRGAEGIPQMQQGLELNPRDPMRWRYMAYLARAYTSSGEYETGADWARKAVLLRPDLPEAQFRYAVCLGHLDKVEDARAALARCDDLDPSYVERKATWSPYPDADRNQHLLSGLRRHGLLP